MLRDLHVDWVNNSVILIRINDYQTSNITNTVTSTSTSTATPATFTALQNKSCVVLQPERIDWDLF